MSRFGRIRFGRARFNQAPAAAIDQSIAVGTVTGTEQAQPIGVQQFTPPPSPPRVGGAGPMREIEIRDKRVAVATVFSRAMTNAVGIATTANEDEMAALRVLLRL